MTDKTNPPGSPLQLVITQYGLKNHVRKDSCTPESQNPTTDAADTNSDTDTDTDTASNTHAALLMQAVIDKLELPAMWNFLDAVFDELEVILVLSQKIGMAERAGSLRIRSLLDLAMDVMRWCPFEAPERDAVFMSTFLHGIEYWLKACVMGESSVRDVMFTIIRPHLQTLAHRSERCAENLRLCMGWGNDDDESAFTTWLRDRMRRAIAVMELKNF